MNSIREMLEEQERVVLSSFAKLSSETKGRLKKDRECDIRPSFQHDRDRIIHSKAFRRLKHKTQVFLSPTGDHYRTRLTHTLEVSQISRTIAKALRLNEDLTEAIALGHDLGHTPFGHAGEAILNELLKEGFRHWEQSLRVVDIIEKDGEGLNLTYEVREGILKHSKGKGEILGDDIPSTLEGQIVRISDIIAYINHDIDDAIRAGILSNKDLPYECLKILGNSHSKRIDKMVKDVIMNSFNKPKIYISEEILKSLEILRDFLYTNLYESEDLTNEHVKASKIIRDLYEYFLDNESAIPESLKRKEEPIERIVVDYIAGMTDRYALTLYKNIFIPKSWRNLYGY
jgi:dGTPase